PPPLLHPPRTDSPATPRPPFNSRRLLIRRSYSSNAERLGNPEPQGLTSCMPTSSPAPEGARHWPRRRPDERSPLSRAAPYVTGQQTVKPRPARAAFVLTARGSGPDSLQPCGGSGRDGGGEPGGNPRTDAGRSAAAGGELGHPGARRRAAVRPGQIRRGRPPSRDAGAGVRSESSGSRSGWRYRYGRGFGRTWGHGR